MMSTINITGTLMEVCTVFLLCMITCLPSVKCHSIISSRDILANMGRNYNKPEQIHISFGATLRDIIVMWSCKVNEKAHVEFGNSPNSLATVESDIVELKQHSGLSKKFIHRAELKGLEPGTRYTYRIVNALSKIKSEDFRFDVPPNDTKKPHSFMVVADMGLQSKTLHFVIHEALSNKYEAFFHIGDIAYNLDSNDGANGDLYMNKIQKMASALPYITTPGDHERFYNFYHYRHRFSMPKVGWPMKEDELWYSFDIGPAHFISVNTESLQEESFYLKEHLAWLKKDLTRANENRLSHPWIIVMGHKPFYCTVSTLMEQACDKEESELRTNVEDIFFEHGVDLYLSGHKHCYERSWPMYRKRHFQTDYVNPNAPVYIIIGAMGYEYMTDEQKSNPAWLAFANVDHNKELYAKLSIINATHLSWTALNAANNEVVDFMQIVQNHHGSFGQPGQAALDKIHPAYQTEAKNNLPPAPYIIIDEPPTSFLSVNRRLMLTLTVFSLSLVLLFFLKNPKVRKVIRLTF